MTSAELIRLLTNKKISISVDANDLVIHAVDKSLGPDLLRELKDHKAELIDTFRVLIPIQACGSGVPLFCVARPNVNAFGFVALSRALGPDQPVYTLQSQLEMVPGMDFRDEQYRITARDYVRAMKVIQPEGPYHLIGQCQGSYIGFEMIRQLESVNERVGFWGVLDTWTEENTRVRWRFYLSELWNRMVQLRLGKIVRISKTAVDRETPTIYSTQHSNRAPDAHSGRKEMYARYWPAKPFIAPTCQTPITVFRVRKQSWFRTRDSALGWGNRSCGGVNWVVVPGEHMTFMRFPHVNHLATAISECMHHGCRVSEVARA